MKLNEFQEKLTTVSDAKLRLMLADSRRKGPEVAVRLILAEAERRGVDLNAVPEPGGTGGMEESAGVSGLAGEGGESAGPAGSSGAGGIGQAGEGTPETGLAAGKGAWLTEEANQGMPMFLKILITVAVLGGILAGLVFLLGRQ